MRKTIRYVAAVLAAAVLLAGFAAPGTAVYASSATFEFTTEKEEVRVDDVIEVVLTLTADITPGQFEGYISYDSDVLEYVTGPNVITGGEGILKVNDQEPDTRYNVRKYSLFFKAIGIGTSTISMRGTPEVYEADQGYLMSVSVGTISIKVLASARASSDASLGALKISPGTLTPAFSTNIYEYSVTVPYETEELLVSAAPNDAHATIKTEGNTELDVGQNRVLIIVTAQDGTTQKYVIYAARQDKAAPPSGEDAGNGTNDTVEPTEGNEPQANSGIEQPTEGFYFYATDSGDDVLLNAGAQYRICRDDGSIAVPSGYFKTSILISGHTVTAYSPTEDLSSDFLLLILSRNGGSPELYSFDRVEKTLQRFSAGKKDGAINNNTASGYSTIDEQELVAGYEKSLSSLTLVVAILSGACMLLLILTIRMAMKIRKKPASSGRSGGGRPAASGGTARSRTSASSSGTTRRRT